ncbi:MAG: phosphoribosylformylglycinamidine synthase subunit PurS, partial [Gemmatimonadetes bacterium]|nr:phosphoribosylformylglycinamidine synthase subunit PurS [Gemmatimonadota bacterium]
MKPYRIEVRITPREGLLDPEGKAVEHALHSLAFDGVSGVHVGRLVRLRLDAENEEEARARAEA